MRKIVTLLVVIILLIIAGAAYFFSKPTPTSQSPTSPTTNTSQQITFPQGNETLSKGERYTLRWTADAGASQVKTQIFLINSELESQGASVSIADRVYNIDNNGSYTYTVPQNIPDGKYKFEIGNLTSNTFQIVSGQTTPYCLPQDLVASLAVSHGAGNVYGTFTMKNTSDKTCNIVGDTYITANYDSKTITNIEIQHQGQAVKQIFTLAPGQILYSQVHYPNGPQCSGPTKTAGVSFSYPVSPQNTITFADQNNIQMQNIMVCQSNEKTTIDIWNIAATPITPQ